MPGPILSTACVSFSPISAGPQYFSLLEWYQTQLGQEGCYLPQSSKDSGV